MTPISAEEFELLSEFIASHLGLVHVESKAELLELRLRPRMRDLGLDRFMDYFLRLQFDAEGELYELARAVTNGESFFMRESDALEALLESEGEKAQSENRSLCVLSAGCSGGEEPYSLSYLAQERIRRRPGGRVEIDAFDVNLTQLERAIAGEYDEASLRRMDSMSRARCFLSTEGTRYSVRAPIRTSVRFSWGNLLQPETFSRPRYYDAILCRNVLIYFSEQSKIEVVRSLARCLKPGGLLLLGHSEMLVGISDEFQLVQLGPRTAHRRLT